MRTLSVIAGGSLLGVVGLAGLLLMPAAETQATPTAGTTIQLWGRVRDFLPSPAHPDFNVVPSNGYGPYCGNVAATLDSEGKPVFTGNGWRRKKAWRDSNNREISWNVCVAGAPWNDSAGQMGPADHGAITSQSTFSQWFRDVPGVNMSRLWKLNLTWQYDSSLGKWAYGWDTNDFNPVDNQLQGNGHGNEHNFQFTYEVQCRFTYDATAGQFLWFKGDDDCWVFINSKLGLDHGGIAGSRDIYVDLNRPVFGLSNGQEYNLTFFLAERHQPQSQFHLRTNIGDLHSVGTDAVLSAYD
jgi:fibro-slime domain-containing protein